MRTLPVLLFLLFIQRLFAKNNLCAQGVLGLRVLQPSSARDVAFHFWNGRGFQGVQK